jgi:hypothetical protein
MNLADDVKKLKKDVSAILKLLMNIRSGGGGGVHNLLSGTHPDTTIAAPQRGDVITGQGATPKWARLAKGAAGQVLISDGTDMLMGWADHGQLIGLGDDDHPQYAEIAGVENITGLWSYYNNNIYLYRDNVDATTSPHLIGEKYRLSAPHLPLQDDGLFMFTGQGWDGGAYRSGARILFSVDGTPGASDMPGRITFWTTLDGGSALYERMRIDNAGNVRIGGSDALVERFNLNGRLALVETGVPGATAGWGKLFANSADGLLYFLDSAGNLYDLTGGGHGTAPTFFRGPGSVAYGGWAVYGNGALNFGRCYLGLSGAATYVGDDTGPLRHHTCGTATRGGYFGNFTEVRVNQSPTGWFRIKTDAAIANIIIWVGFVNAVPTSNADDPGGSSNYAQFVYSTTLPNPNWYFVTKDGVAQNLVDTGVAVAINTVYDFKIRLISGGSAYWWVTPYGGATTSGNTALHLPPASLDLGMQMVAFSKSGTVYFNSAYAYFEANL